MNIYDLSRSFWDFAFENPDKIKPNHSAMFFFAVEHCNRLGWKEKFGFPSTLAMEAIGIKSYNTYINTLNELVEFGFIRIIEKSKNQYSSNVIALSNFNKAYNEALDKALTKHLTKQSESTVQSIDSINIPIYNNTNLQIHKEEAVASEIPEEKKIEEPKTLETSPDERKKVPQKKESEKFFSKADFKKRLLELGVVEKYAIDWIQVRKDKRASFTESVIDGIRAECEKYNFPFPDAIKECAERSWQGFKYSWLDNKQTQNGNQQRATRNR
ncbi:hypothetical protein BBD31_01715 [Elizabethkingia anophelis]|uniref:hypothetical protein n=1 Tax=Elizabethkingia anophelis TaxID=1117645 RepID=UPI00099591F2|nr:hypothetical protein [Elizabethkingia anophelis]AQW96692.1 hypothetical protein BBD31_01715 [Elizabethkingia anophelis]MDV3673687.1 hypothetical protein [Elizabethkingia anophelis]MDV3692411.1 hypothetical protein [Elizabethkingia anophelis]OPB50058.1 hypothetical protein BAY04_06785 [Elizabethkingia anophelis]SPW16850.1 Uncharacterised protein [Elizabethkingia anophelis]